MGIPIGLTFRLPSRVRSTIMLRARARSTDRCSNNVKARVKNAIRIRPRDRSTNRVSISDRARVRLSIKDQS